MKVISESEKTENTSCTLDKAILTDTQLTKLEIEPRQTLLHPWARKPSIILASAAPGVGKSWTALSIVDALTTGGSFGRWKVETTVPCLYVDGEMVIQDIQERLTAFGTTHRKQPLYIYSDHYALDQGIRRADLLSEWWRLALDEFIQAKGIGFVVLDNIASLAPGIDESDKQQWDVINQWLLRLRFKGVSVMLLHHLSKQGQQRGTSAREDNIDISILLKRPKNYSPQDGARFIVEFKKARVPMKDLPLLEPMEFKMLQEKGRVNWDVSKARTSKRKEIIQRLADGCKQADVAQELDVDPSYVSKVKKDAIRDGQLTEDNKLTEAGEAYVRFM